MTTPNYPQGRYAPLFYPNHQGYYALPPQNAINVFPPQQLGTYQNQLPYQYFLQPPTYLAPQQTFPLNVTISPGMMQAPQSQQAPLVTPV